MVIEDKDIGIKVAVDEEEALWVRIRDKAAQQLRESKAEIELQEAVLKIAESHIKH